MISGELLKEAGLESLDVPSERVFPGVSTDTRKIERGQLFFCLEGPNFDAHAFVFEAFQKGAAAVVIARDKKEAVAQSIRKKLSEPGSVALSEGLSLQDYLGRILMCQDPLASLQKLAHLHRKRQGYTVFGITGSNGKTSAKEMLLGMLSHLLGEPAVDATRGNLNNHIGLPLTLLNFKAGISHAIVEMGMNHAGEIDALSKISEPDHGLITSIGRAHIEFFYSKRGIARAKQEMTLHCRRWLSYPVAGIGKSSLLRKSLQDGSPGIALFGFEEDASWKAVPARIIQNNLWTFFKAKNLEFGPAGIGFEIEIEGKFHRIENGHYFSRVQAENLLGCIATLLKAGFSTEDVLEAARFAAPVSGGRFHIIKKDERVLVDDTYNANPDSFLAAIDSLRKMLPEGKLLCLAGSMAELGQNSDSAHQEVGRALKQSSYEIQATGPAGGHYLEGFGLDSGAFSSDATADGLARFFFPNSEDLADHIERYPQYYLSFDGILAKGSRSARMERACDALKRIGYV
ncbi:MAG: hypothetical protein CMN76_01560 [Spirochaetaceae bacterium]|nr:hypothetical protein [Spirochaetaceae bacterium]|tara:strand:+ start:5635 stop:7182 length:1548 start_codon:yes stop_codon:yes gene_type:complete